MPSPYERPYLDSCVFIALVKGEAGRSDLARKIIQDAQAGKFQAITSTFVIAEVIGYKDHTRLTVAQETTIDAFFDHHFITLVELDATLARDARRLARTYRLRAPDAVHLASALRAGADQLLTWDRSLLDAGVHELVVCEPWWEGQLTLDQQSTVDTAIHADAGVAEPEGSVSAMVGEEVEEIAANAGEEFAPQLARTTEVADDVENRGGGGALAALEAVRDPGSATAPAGD